MASPATAANAKCAPGPGEGGHGNIILLEHLNLNTDDPEASLAFFLEGLGCAQDPRLGEAVGDAVYVNGVLWLNAGLSQFHMPLTSRGSGGALNNVLRGRVGIAVSSLPELRQRLRGLEEGSGPLARGRTRFAWRDADGGAEVEVTDPAGNVFAVREQEASARDTRGYHPGPLSWCLGMPFVEFRCPRGAAPGIARYYEHYMGARVEAEEGSGEASVWTGPQQRLRFVEGAVSGSGADEEEPYHLAERGLHICFYILDHSGPMRRLCQDGLLWGNPRFRDLDRRLGTTQFRCKDIVDPWDTARPRTVLLEVEHEVRTLQHQTSPFGHAKPYTLPGRERAVPQLVSAVTQEYERDFAEARAKTNSIPEGFVPMPDPIPASIL